MLAGTLVAFWATSNREATFAHRRDTAFADRAAGAVTTAFDTSLATLAGASALRAPNGDIDAGAFATFAGEVIHQSALDALAASVLVTADDRAGYEAATGRPITDRAPDGKFVPAAERPTYLPVRYALPDDATRRAVIGFDVAADPERHDAVERATITGVGQVAAVRLAPSGRPGLFVVYPIMDSGRAVGVVSSAFLASDVTPLVAKLLPGGSSFELRTSDGAVLAALGHGPFEATSTVHLEGLDLVVATNDGIGPGEVVPRFVLASGLLLALFLTLFFATSFRQERNVVAALALARQSEARAAGLLAVSTTLSRGVTADEVSRSLLRWAEESLDAAGGAIVAVDTRGALTPLGERGRAVPAGLLQHPVDDGAQWEDGADGHATALSLPLVADGIVSGVAGFVFEPPIPAGDARRALAEGVAPQAGRALLRAGRRDREQEVTLALQARLLPPSLPEVPGLAVTARYLAAAEGTLVGGDWYDVVPLDTGHVLLTVGDVVGRGPAAAALMGQLRTLMHEAALRSDDPADAVRAIDAIAARTEDVTGSTCVAIDLDPHTGALRYARAGHPWPLIVGPNGARWLDASGGGPLGVHMLRPAPAEATLALGETLVLFTDGAVERRTESIDIGLARLADAASSSWQHGPDVLCDAILDRVPAGADDDLVLLVAART